MAGAFGDDEGVVLPEELNPQRAENGPQAAPATQTNNDVAAA